MKNIKLVVVGDGAIGKTCILRTFCDKEFSQSSKEFPNQMTEVVVGGTLYRLHLFRGKEFDELCLTTYPATDVFVICFSVVSPSSFENVKEKWVPDITQNCPNTPFLLVGTQVDLRDDPSVVEKLAKNKQKPISLEQGDKLACELKAFKYVECSALTQKGLKNVYDEAILATLKPPQPEERKKCSIL